MVQNVGHDLTEKTQRQVLLISNSVIGPEMSGPGIRCWEFARVLSVAPGLALTLATTPGVSACPPGGEPGFCLYAALDEGNLLELATQADVVIAPGAVVSLFPSLRGIQPPLVLDLYIPLMLEELQRTRPESLAEQALVFDGLRRALSAQVLAADFILCASEKQRDYWLGALSALGRVNPFTHRDDPTLRSLIDVVPFGLPAEPPRHTRQVLKGAFPGIDTNDKVLLWGGGLWDWLDTSTLLHAMASLRENRPDIKLFFMGVKHHNPQESQRRGARETMALASELGMTEKTVFFNDWVPYEERANYLLEADVGISLHRDHLESRFSFRTRFLDNLWAALPLIAARGDVLSQEVEKRGLGRVVEPGDVEGLVAAILEMVDRPNLREKYLPRFQKAAQAYVWTEVTRPLVAFCQLPHRAPDKDYVRNMPLAGLGPTPWWQLPSRAWRALRLGGVSGLMRQGDQYRRWLLTRRGRHSEADDS
jgi:glycosyltransferase involved in cell wall biosynthesis